ncbi:MAG: ROK family protein [Saprospiraceae bacterium]|nr:ROK family protein [Saprospiraceae bacterium]
MGKKSQILGVDIGGTGLKCAMIDVDKGELVTEKYRELTPQPSTPEAVAKAIKGIIQRHDYKGPVGCGFPAIIHGGVAKSAANIDDSWLNVNVEELFEKATGNKFFVANDADVAGLAEVRFGEGNGVDGTVIVLTIGTGIGSGTFLDGKLMPNTEFGHLLYKDDIYEKHVSNAARKRNNLSWEEWGSRFCEYLLHLEKLFSPDLFILGGGASKKMEQYAHTLTCETKVIAAEFQNDAGVLGAALYARSRMKKKKK